MRTIQRQIAGTLLVSKDGKIFLAQHKAGGTYPDCWIIVGGGLEPGETAEEAMRRETLEETGIDVTGYPAEIVATATGQSEKTLRDTGERVMVDMNFTDFRVMLPHNAADIPPAPDDEFARTGWFSQSELIGLTFSPPTETLLRQLGYIT